eukprot:6715642-Alexandrium_andersonii.AAC.1
MVGPSLGELSLVSVQGIPMTVELSDPRACETGRGVRSLNCTGTESALSLIHISEPTRLALI